MFAWLAMVTGARRGELCALRWNCLDTTAGVLLIRSSLDDTDRRVLREKSTKPHQHRRIALDELTSALLASYRRRRAEEAAMLDVVLSEDSWMFSKAPDCSTPLTPDSVTNRYVRMFARIGIKAHLHQLRHYSATELISAGVDVRTAAGRLGHSGGGVTTLRVYSAWRSEADQRAARDMVLRAAGPTGAHRRSRHDARHDAGRGRAPVPEDRRRPARRDQLRCP
jgi:integrase